MVDGDAVISQELPFLHNISMDHVVCLSKVLGHCQSLIWVFMFVLFYDSCRNPLIHQRNQCED